MSPIKIPTFGNPDAEAHKAIVEQFAGYVTPRFAGRVAAVTGGGSGIGRATCERLAAEGAAVAVIDVQEDAAATTAKAIAASGGAARPYVCDVTSEPDVHEIVAAIHSDFGPVRALCNAAGIGGFYLTAEMPVERWRAIIEVNLTGPFIMCKAVLPDMLEHGGSIVNVASNTALMGQAYSAAYCSSKAGVAMLTRALAAEFIGKGVRVNTVAPGGVDTPLLGKFNLPDGIDTKVLDRMMTPMGFSAPEEIAASIAFLLSEESAYTTGAILSVDGGLTV